MIKSKPEPVKIRAIFDLVAGLISSRQGHEAYEFLENNSHLTSYFTDDDHNTEWFLYRLASLSLSTAQTLVCDKILEMVPPSRHKDEWYKSLRSLNESFKCVESDTCFFPLSIPFDKWEKGPHILPNINAGGQPLTMWYTGRVDLVTFEDIKIKACQRSAWEDTSLVMNLPLDKVFKWSYLPISFEDLDEGLFLEIGVYGHDDRNPVIMFHENDSNFRLDLPATPS